MKFVDNLGYTGGATPVKEGDKSSKLIIDVLLLMKACSRGREKPLSISFKLLGFMVFLTYMPLMYMFYLLLCKVLG